ncbi:MAG: hypothetical protein VKN83_06030 [Cyanobacteriota bacterium]|nr:hypothetical protein [Cyanobacteriota bacterium]
MITLSISEALPSTSTLLAALASGLLLFVTAGVVYLSAVDWQDKRRRRDDKPRKR